MAFVKLQDLILNIAERSGAPETMTSAYVIEIVQKNIASLLGIKATLNVIPKSFNNGELVLHVSSSVWASEIKLKEIILKRRINLLLHKSLVLKVRTRVTSLIEDETI